jgi:quinol monooxygenase YgiN
MGSDTQADSHWMQEEQQMHISKESTLVTLINVFETTPEQQQALIDQWVRFTEEVKEEPGFVGAALHKSTDGTRMINYAHWKSQVEFDAFLQRHSADFARFSQNASRLDPHTYEVVYLHELAD